MIEPNKFERRKKIVVSISSRRGIPHLRNSKAMTMQEIVTTSTTTCTPTTPTPGTGGVGSSQQAGEEEEKEGTH